MSNTAIVLAVGGTLLVVGGTVAFLAFKRKEVKEAPAKVMPEAAAAAAASPPARQMSVADALVILGGKALTEGIKYAVAGPTGYAGMAAAREQKAA